MTGRAWTNEEERRLLNELAQGDRLDAIAISHNRTQGAISSRQRHMAADFYRNGVSLGEIAARCRMRESEVKRVLFRRKLIDSSSEFVYVIRDRNDGLNFGYVKTQSEAERICAELPSMFTWEALAELDARLTGIGTGTGTG